MEIRMSVAEIWLIHLEGMRICQHFISFHQNHARCEIAAFDNYLYVILVVLETICLVVVGGLAFKNTGKQIDWTPVVLCAKRADLICIVIVWLRSILAEITLGNIDIRIFVKIIYTFGLFPAKQGVNVLKDAIACLTCRPDRECRHMMCVMTDKMAAILQAIFSIAFSWMKSLVFSFSKFHWILFLMVQLLITHRCFRLWLAPNKRQATTEAMLTRFTDAYMRH